MPEIKRTFVWIKDHMGRCVPKLIYGDYTGDVGQDLLKIEGTLLFKRELDPFNLSDLVLKYPCPSNEDEKPDETCVLKT